MIIEDNPTFNKDLRTFTTTKHIDTFDDIVISINGMWAIYDNDITVLDSRTLKVSELCEIDWEEDELAVIYTAK
jgi:hypothetical protein